MFSGMEAARRARSIINDGGRYQLGTGDYRPMGHDLPWTDNASDCAGFALCWCLGILRHRPGFNIGEWATVSDDVNCNSAIEDAEHKRELFRIAEKPVLGALLTYPTFMIGGHRFVGHVGIVIGFSHRFEMEDPEWDASRPEYRLLDIAHCHGPTGRRPGVTRTDGAIWDHHDQVWHKAEHRTRMIELRPEALAES